MTGRNIACSRAYDENGMYRGICAVVCYREEKL
jgi:heme/copper-type cytochrome/quinol oxidase subunit 2